MGGRLEELVQLDPFAIVLHRDDGIPKLDQVLLLHGEQHLAHTFGLLFAGKFDDEQIGHGSILQRLRSDWRAETVGCRAR